jgi:hypothetical protein
MGSYFVACGLALAVVGGTATTQNVALPDVNTDEGLLVRLFIAESRNPGHKQYNADTAKKGMRAMKAVVDNRLRNNPGQFGAPGAKGYIDIVAAAGQFHGFSKGTNGKILIASDVQKRIDEVVKIANTGKPGKYAAFVQAAIDVAKADVDDPFKDVKKVGRTETTGGSDGWRTAGSAQPGGSFIAIPEANGGVIAGNQFYTLKK